MDGQNCSRAIPEISETEKKDFKDRFRGIYAMHANQISGLAGPDGSAIGFSILDMFSQKKGPSGLFERMRSYGKIRQLEDIHRDLTEYGITEDCLKWNAANSKVRKLEVHLQNTSVTLHDGIAGAINICFTGSDNQRHTISVSRALFDTAATLLLTDALIPIGMEICLKIYRKEQAEKLAREINLTYAKACLENTLPDAGYPEYELRIWRDMFVIEVNLPFDRVAEIVIGQNEFAEEYVKVAPALDAVSGLRITIGESFG